VRRRCSGPDWKPVLGQLEASRISLCSSNRLTLLIPPTALIRFADPRSSGRDRPFPICGHSRPAGRGVRFSQQAILSVGLSQPALLIVC
jgi:hypothetical protein